MIIILVYFQYNLEDHFVNKRYSTFASNAAKFFMVEFWIVVILNASAHSVSMIFNTYSYSSHPVKASFSYIVSTNGIILFVTHFFSLLCCVKTLIIWAIALSYKPLRFCIYLIPLLLINVVILAYVFYLIVNASYD